MHIVDRRIPFTPSSRQYTEDKVSFLTCRTERGLMRKALECQDYHYGLGTGITRTRIQEFQARSEEVETRQA